MIQLPRAGWPAALAAGLAGALAACGLAPFDLWPVGLAGFALGIAIVARARRPGLIAWLFGAGYFALALHWIVEPFFVDAARHGWMAPFALALMAGGMAFFWLAAGWFSRWIFEHSGTDEDAHAARAAVFALALALSEGARAYVFSGFPWAHPGHMLIETPLLAATAWVGPHGLNLLVLGAAAGLVALAPLRAAICYAALVAAIALLPGPAPLPGDGDAPRVRLVQPNAAQHLKWQPEMIPIIYQRGLELSQGPAVDLVVWPETALPVLLRDSALMRAEIAQASGSPVVFGVQRFPDGQARNALALISSDGTIASVYDKHRLVPFGEYIPVRRLAAWAGIDGLAAIADGGYWPGQGPGAIDLDGALGRAFVMICYEAIFPQHIRQIERPDWQLHITNDAWFGDFAGPYQHLALARLRAAEAGLPVLRAANTGISAVIDARGNVLDSLPLNTAGRLEVSLPPPLPLTLYTRIGDWPIIGCIALLLAGSCLGLRQNSR